MKIKVLSKVIDFFGGHLFWKAPYFDTSTKIPQLVTELYDSVRLNFSLKPLLLCHIIYTFSQFRLTRIQIVMYYNLVW